MIHFYTEKKWLLLSYTEDRDSSQNYVKNDLEDKKHALIKKTFHFLPEHIYRIDEPSTNEEEWDAFNHDLTIHLKVGELKGDYYRVIPGILINNADIYFQKDFEFEVKAFVANQKISIFRQLVELTNKDIYIGGKHPDAIPLEVFEHFLRHFPNTYEKDRYAQARVASVLREYFDDMKDAEGKYHSYMKKRLKPKTPLLRKTFKELDAQKYEYILEKLQLMLNSEATIHETQWQDALLEIMLLLNPKYIAVFKGTDFPVDEIRGKQLDFLLVDFNGHVDIIEIKKPFENGIVTKGVYRDNHVPLRELSGSIMQVEKYIYHMNRLGGAGERRLTEKFKNQLPEDMKIKITNPRGIIISSREHNLTEEQRMDFEVVKRKYRNVVDIITYDNLILRLKYMIEQIRKL